MRLKLSTGESIHLPTTKTVTKIDASGSLVEADIIVPVNERLKLVEHVLAKHPEEFKYADRMFESRFGTRQDNNKLVKIKLDILGTYLIRSDKKYNDNVMTRYKEEKRPMQEMSFSQFSDDVVDINGWN